MCKVTCQLTEPIFIESSFFLDDKGIEPYVKHFVFPVNEVRKSVMNDSPILLFL